ncbi:hypothetical protein OROMI_017840 [Orobanche minor]
MTRSLSSATQLVQMVEMTNRVILRQSTGGNVNMGAATILQQEATQLVQMNQSVQQSEPPDGDNRASKWLQDVIKMHPPHFAGSSNLDPIDKQLKLRPTHLFCSPSK